VALDETSDTKYLLMVAFHVKKELDTVISAKLTCLSGSGRTGLDTSMASVADTVATGASV
jgi:hypothetical protein